MQRLRLLLQHNSVPVMILAVLLGAGILVWTAPVWTWAFVLFGIPAQMLNEYSLHRYVFHLKPPQRQWAFDLLYQAHYGHHDFPTNTRLFFAPIWVSVPMLVVNFALVWGGLMLVVPIYALPLAAAIVLVGGVSTFLGYEWFHMTAHLNVRKTRVERHVTTLHNQHHFRDFAKWFHVSPGGEIIDRVMGTGIDREALRNKQRIEFIRTLGMRPDDPRLICARHHFAEKYGLSDKEIEQAAGG
ncbi:sterol desaturase family protein [Roseovarius sp. EL26]|uniref:sterol desaturase family protein n=1 Tax=Roseovarius sp. EL26 TaxID=2126672 RepID=UPI000EA0EABF|nr:sterol desaturase family protein [Roseovarius sp. EL26]